jgi:hypothetical protein
MHCMLSLRPTVRQPVTSKDMYRGTPTERHVQSLKENTPSWEPQQLCSRDVRWLAQVFLASLICEALPPRPPPRQAGFTWLSGVWPAGRGGQPPGRKRGGCTDCPTTPVAVAYLQACLPATQALLSFCESYTKHCRTKPVVLFPHLSATAIRSAVKRLPACQGTVPSCACTAVS